MCRNIASYRRQVKTFLYRKPSKETSDDNQGSNCYCYNTNALNTNPNNTGLFSLHRHVQQQHFKHKIMHLSLQLVQKVPINEGCRVRGATFILKSPKSSLWKRSVIPNSTWRMSETLSQVNFKTISRQNCRENFPEALWTKATFLKSQDLQIPSINPLYASFSLMLWELDWIKAHIKSVWEMSKRVQLYVIYI